MSDSTATRTDSRLLLLAPQDNVFVLRDAIEAGETIEVSGDAVTFEKRIGLGHKIARNPVSAGEKILKYGAPIGSATTDIATGEHVHLHNLASDYTPTYALDRE